MSAQIDGIIGPLQEFSNFDHLGMLRAVLGCINSSFLVIIDNFKKKKWIFMLYLFKNKRGFFNKNSSVTF